MDITRENIDDINAVITVNIVKEDYQTKVAEVLQDYRKKADIPGFRKGNVPMGMIKKQYGMSVMMNEVNKLLNKSLDDFLVNEKQNILGNPLPIENNLSWDEETFSFGFQLGLTPKFTIDYLSIKDKITQYNIVASDSFIDKEVEDLRYNCGETSLSDEATETSEITVTFAFDQEIESNEGEEEEKKDEVIFLKDVKKSNLKKFIGSKIDDVIEFEINELSDDNELTSFLEMYKEDMSESKTVFITIKKINNVESAEVNQDFFDKIFPDGSVKSITELRSKIKENSEKQFQEHANQQLFNTITDYLVENTKFDLPTEFLQKWIRTSGDKELSIEEAEEEYTKSEKGLRYQLIEGKIMEDNNIELDYQELVDYSREFVRAKMAQFGNINPEEKELDDTVVRILENQDEARRLQGQLVNQKLMTFYKENIIFKNKDISYNDFVKEASK